MLWLEHAGQRGGAGADRGALAGEGQGDQDGERGLHGEVDWEEGGLKGGELGAREGFEGYDAGDEGLEDFGAEEGAIAVDSLECFAVLLGGLGCL